MYIYKRSFPFLLHVCCSITLPSLCIKVIFFKSQHMSSTSFNHVGLHMSVSGCYDNSFRVVLFTTMLQHPKEARREGFHLLPCVLGFETPWLSPFGTMFHNVSLVINSHLCTVVWKRSDLIGYWQVLFHIQ